MKKTTRIISLLLSGLMMTSVASATNINVSAKAVATQQAGETAKSGECGDNAKWSLNTETGELTITGTGAINSYNCYYDDEESAPWSSFTSQIKSLTISDGITEIGSWAFYKCTRLESVSIPDSVITIYSGAFEQCTKLSNITLPKGLERISTNVFDNTAYYDNADNWKDDVLYIDNYLIYAKQTTENEDESTTPGFEASEYTVKDGTTLIADGAFDSCSSLEKVTIPDSVEYIGWRTFRYCEKLNTIKISTNLKGIGYNAFYDTAFYNDSSNWDSDDVLYLDNYLIDVKDSYYDDDYNYVQGFSEKKYTVKSGTTIIANSAFEECETLKVVTIPDTVTVIDDYAFDSSTNLARVYIPKSVEKIGYRAFISCSKLKDIYYQGSESDWANIKIDSDNEELSNANVIYNSAESDVNPTLVSGICGSNVNYSLNTTTGEMTIKGTGDMYAYNDDDSDYGDVPWSADMDDIKSVVISEGVTSICNSAFSDCTNLSKVTIPTSIKKIGWSAFRNCENLNMISLPENITSIGYLAFYNTGYYNTKSNWDSDGVLYIDKYLIATNSSNSDYYNSDVTTFDKKDYTVKTGTKLVANSAFEYCSTMVNVVLPDTLTAIDDWAFDSCYALKSVYIPKSVTTIGYKAFDNCSKLSDINYPGAEAEWNNIKIDSNNEYLTDATVNYNYGLDTSEKITLNFTAIKTLYVKQIKNLEVDAIDEEGFSVGGTRYKSSDTNVVKVTGYGTLKAMGVGTATITVKNGKTIKTFDVTVKNPTLSKKSITVKKGKTATVKITGKAKYISNSYTNTKIAKVVSSKSATTLKIKALKKGTTTLKIKVNGVSLKLKVKVR